jgi:hypothetical protein
MKFFNVAAVMHAAPADYVLARSSLADYAAKAEIPQAARNPEYP